MSEGRPQVTLVTPMYEEGDTIGENVAELLACLERLDCPYEFILVDDGSRDGSLEKAQEALADRKNCHLIHYDRNRGRGYALRQGFQRARGEFVIATESDLSWGNDIVEKLLAHLQESNADMVIASIHKEGGGLKGIPAHRRWLSSWGNRLLCWAYGTKLTMLTGMTRGYKRESLQTLHLEEDRKEIHLEIVSKAQILGWHIEEIPVVMEWKKGRVGGRVMRFVLPHLAVTFHRGGVKFLVYLSLFAAAIGVPTVFISILNKLFRILPYIFPYLAIYGALLIVFSLVCAMFAIIGLQASVIYKSLTHLQCEVKKVQLLSMKSDDSKQVP